MFRTALRDEEEMGNELLCITGSEAHTGGCEGGSHRHRG